MELGITLRKLDEVKLTWFDLVLFPVRQVTGETQVAVANGKIRPVISCFGHTALTSKFPDWVAVSDDGLPALPGKRNLRDGFAWGWICPNVEEYRSELLQFVKREANKGWNGLHLDSVQFPEANYCHCHRCKDKFSRSGIKDWLEWRVSVIAGWIEIVARETSKPLSLTVHPDPYFLRERFGTDLNLMAPYLEWCLVPLYCLTYSLTYWLDTILYAFVRLSPVPIFVELYAVEPRAIGVLKAMATVAKFPISGIVLYDPYGKKVQELSKILREDESVRELVASHPNRRFRELAERIAEWW